MEGQALQGRGGHMLLLCSKLAELLPVAELAGYVGAGDQTDCPSSLESTWKSRKMRCCKMAPAR